MDKKTITLLVTVGLAVAALLYGWYKPPQTITRTEYVKVPDIRETVKIKRVEIPIEKIVTIEKIVVVDRLNLPAWIRDDESKQVIATGDFPSTRGGYTAAAIIDTKTGEGQIVAKEKRQPFFAWLNEKEIGGVYGLSTDSPRDWLAYGQWTPGRVGPIHGAIYTDGGPSRGFVGVKVFARW